MVPRCVAAVVVVLRLIGGSLAQAQPGFDLAEDLEKELRRTGSFHRDHSHWSINLREESVLSLLSNQTSRRHAQDAATHECAEGFYMDESFGECRGCAPGFFSDQEGGVSRDGLIAGYGNLVLGLPTGNSRAAHGINGDPELNTCEYHSCLEECTCEFAWGHPLSLPKCHYALNIT